jgi:hypothetical protein
MSKPRKSNVNELTWLQWKADLGTSIDLIRVYLGSPGSLSVMSNIRH